MNKKILFSVLALLFLGGFAYINKPQPISQKEVIKPAATVINAANKKEGIIMNKPTIQIDTKKQYQAILKTEKGEILIDLFAVQTPITVNNFIYLAKSNFYNNTIFHRTIPGFMIQGGDPTGTGSGGPGYKFDDEEFSGEYSRGTVAMANAGPNTNGSQFFIMHQDNPLPPNYVIFGRVSEGMDVVDSIATAATNKPISPVDEGSTPVNPVKIESVEIIEK